MFVPIYWCRPSACMSFGWTDASVASEQRFLYRMPCRYHCTKLPDVDLCPRAFAEGRFPPGTCTKDFVRIASATGRSHMAGSSEAQPGAQQITYFVSLIHGYLAKLFSIASACGWSTRYLPLPPPFDVWPAHQYAACLACRGCLVAAGNTAPSGGHQALQ